MMLKSRLILLDKMDNFYRKVDEGKKRAFFRKGFGLGKLIFASATLFYFLGGEENRRPERGDMVEGMQIDGDFNHDRILDYAEVLDSEKRIGRICLGTKDGWYDCGVVEGGEYSGEGVFLETESGRRYDVFGEEIFLPRDFEDWLAFR
jgi:hypothetical protein